MDLNLNSEMPPRANATKQPIAAPKSKNEAPNVQKKEQNNISQAVPSQLEGTNSPNKVDLKV